MPNQALIFILASKRCPPRAVYRLKELIGYYHQNFNESPEQPGIKYIIMLRDDIGKRIAELRKERKLSQVDLALKTGLDKGHIARIELGRYSVGVDTLQKIADALNVKIELIE